MLLTFFLIFHILGIISAVNAVMSARTSQGSIAWMISLIAFPYVAVPAYWFLGSNKFESYKYSRKNADKIVHSKFNNLLDELEIYKVKESQQGFLEITMQHLSKTPYLQGNAVELLIDGENTFNSILDGLKQAKKYILLEFYIVRDDNLGREIQRLLINKANEGVKIYFLYDEIGCYQLSHSYILQMQKAGIKVFGFHSEKEIKNKFQINFRNHRKIVVVDGNEAWIGGHNIGDEYLSKNNTFGHWRDTHMKISGPTVIPIQITFIEDWYWATGNFLSNLYWKPPIFKENNKKILILPSSPADMVETASLMFIEAINSATEYVWISSPYFVPDIAVIKALQLAGLRGIDVRILIPKKADHILVYLAAFTYFKSIGETGVKFFRYNHGFLHQKAMIIDSSHVTIGTANLDNRSFRLNFEMSALISDETFAKEVKQMFENDFNNSFEIDTNEIDSKSASFKFLTRLARLTSPLL